MNEVETGGNLKEASKTDNTKKKKELPWILGKQVTLHIVEGCVVVTLI